MVYKYKVAQLPEKEVIGIIGLKALGHWQYLSLIGLGRQACRQQGRKYTIRKKL